MVTLRKIDESNFSECLKLDVCKNQKNFVASNVFSLAQSWLYYDTAYPFAVYADEIMVGFVKVGYYEEKNIYTLWRLMIDERFQNKGYGKEALLLAIKFLKDKFAVKEVFLSFVIGNEVAEKLYSNVGFKRTGEIENGEIIMKLCLS